MVFIISACLLIPSSQSMCFSYLLRVLQHTSQYGNIRNKTIVLLFVSVKAITREAGIKKHTVSTVLCEQLSLIVIKYLNI